MAMPYARPDPSSPAAVADATFGTSRRGFDHDEVRDFLRMVAAELGRLQERERFLERELRQAQTNPDLDRMRLDDQTLTRLLGEETVRVLAAARESATEIRSKAEDSAARLLSEAADEAARLREEAEIESSRRRADAASDAEAELAMAKQQGREMVNEARAYRERVLSELARRRELAREQIEQLLHGRDRLMQSFEHARLVAVDVVSELEPLGPPDEYVDLTPTTGPVPVTVPAGRRPPPSEPVVQRPPAESEDAPADGATTDEAEARVEVVDEVEGPTDVEGDDADVGDHDAANDVGASADEADEEPTEEASSDQIAPDGDPAARPETDAETESGAVADTAASDADGEDDADREPASDPVADVSDAAAETTDAEADEAPGDVVVDLFARLRAETANDESAEGDDDVEAAPVASEDATPEQSIDRTADGSSGAESPFAQRSEALTPLIVAGARRLKRTLADEQNEVLNELRGGAPVTELAAIVPSADDHGASYRLAIADELEQAAVAAAASVGAELDADGLAEAVGAGGDSIDEWLVVPLRDRIERCVADADGDNAAIGSAVRSVYREWKTQHIDDQLDDVMHAVYGRAILAAVGDSTPVEWTADPERPCCADCDDNTLAGCVRAGEQFPTGNAFAPAHPGCRCLLVRTDG